MVRVEASEARRVATSTAVQAAGKVTVLLIGAASIATLTRYLGPAGYGSVVLAVTFVQLFSVLADVGLFTIVVREISKAPERTRELVGNAMAIRLVLSFVAIAASSGASLLLPYTPQVRVAVLIAGVPLLLGMLNTSFVAIFQSRLQMGRAAIGDVAGRAAAFAAVVVVVLLDFGFYAVVATAAVGNLVTLTITASFARRFGPIRLRRDRAIWRELLVASIPLGLALALNELYFRADNLIISLFRPIEEVGMYALAFRVIELGSTIPVLLITSVFPLLSRYVVEDEPRARRTIQAGSDFFVTVGAPIAIVGPVIAPSLIELVAGADFGGAVVPLQILLPSAALALINGLFGYALIAKGKQASALWLNGVGLSVNIGLNLALVPSFGIDAAAATAVVSELVILAGSFFLMRRFFAFFPSLGVGAKALAAAIATAAALLPFREATVLLLAPLGAALYGSVLYAVGGVDRALLQRLGR